MAAPSANCSSTPRRYSSSARMNSSDTRAEYSSLIGVMLMLPSVAPPALFAPFSATMSASLSRLKVKIFSPVNGIGLRALRRASEEWPLTLFIMPATSSGGKLVLIESAAMFFTSSFFFPALVQAGDAVQDAFQRGRLGVDV